MNFLVIFKVSIVCLASLIISSAATPAKNDLEAEVIVDQFEKLIMKRDRKRFMVGEKDEGAKPRAKSQYKFGASSITGGTPVSGDLKSIQTILTKLERSVGLLEAEIQKTHSQLSSSSKIRNSVSVSTELITPETTQIRNLTVQVDGLSVMSYSDARGVGLEASNFQVYNGPLKPGKHKLSVEAHLIAKGSAKRANPLNMGIFKHLKKEFEVDVPSGEVKQKYHIQLELGSKPNSQPSAKIAMSGSGNVSANKEAAK